MMEIDSNHFIRETCQRKLHTNRFITKGKKCDKQYCYAYSVRNQRMRPRLYQAAKNKWGQDVKITNLTNLQRGMECYLIGTLFKCMELQPSILTEISEKEDISVQPSRERYIGEKDRLILEDEQQRISLKGNFEVDECFTGTLVALKGIESDPGYFTVSEMVHTGIPVQEPLPQIKENKYVLMISGLELGSKSDKLMNVQMLLDYVIGLLGADNDHKTSSEIIHVIVAGNSLSGATQDKESQKRAKYLTYKEEAKTVEGVKLIDNLLGQLVPFVSVDLMSGEFDPCNYLIPQQPLHWCMVPQCAAYRESSFRAVTNPYDCEINSVRFMGTSGQNINNMRMFGGVMDCIKLLEHTLRCSHIAPTAPDTLGSFPYYDEDPFIIDACPHVYFAGNQPTFDSKVVVGNNNQSVLLVSIPTFSKSQTAVLVNIKDLTAMPISFGDFWND